MPLQPEGGDEGCDLNEEQRHTQGDILARGKPIDAKPYAKHAEHAKNGPDPAIAAALEPEHVPDNRPALLNHCAHLPRPPSLALELRSTLAAPCWVAFHKLRPSWTHRRSSMLLARSIAPEPWSGIRDAGTTAAHRTCGTRCACSTLLAIRAVEASEAHALGSVDAGRGWSPGGVSRARHALCLA
eukprot:2647040-Rhodomonas_salina.1